VIPGEEDPEPNGLPADFNPAPREERYTTQSWKTVQQYIARKLQEASIPASSDKWNLTVEEELAFDPASGIVKLDASIFDTDKEYSKYSCYGIEINTPIFNFTKFSMDQIEKGLSVIPSSCRVATNQRCGVHVHVGNAEKVLISIRSAILQLSCGLLRSN
jgi:hypothetical protein